MEEREEEVVVVVVVVVQASTRLKPQRPMDRHARGPKHL